MNFCGFYLRLLLCVGIFSSLPVCAQKNKDLRNTLKQFPGYLNEELKGKKSELQELRITAKTKKDRNLMFLSNYYLGQLSPSANNNEAAKFYYRESLSFGENLHDSLKIGHSSFQLGLIYLDEMNFDSTIHYFMLSRDAFEHSSPIFHSKSISLIGELFFKFEGYKSAMNYFQRSAALNRKLSARETNIPYSYWLIAEAHYALNDRDSALFYYRLSSSIADTTRGIPYYGNEGIAQVKIDKGEYDSALYYLKPVKKWYLDSGNSLWISDLGILYMKIYEKKGNVAQFNRWRKLTNQHAFSNYLPEQQKRYYDLLSSYFEVSGQYDSAYYYLKLSKQVGDGLIAKRGSSNSDALIQAYEEQQNKVDRVSLESELSKSKLRNKLSQFEQSDLRAQNKMFSVTMALLGLILLLMVFLATQYSRQKRRMSEKVVELESKETRIREMQMSSNNYFAFLTADFKVLQINDSFKKFVGVPTDALTQNGHFKDLVGEKFFYEMRSVVARLNPFESAKINWETEEPNCQIIEFNVVNLLLDPTVKGFVIQGVDITRDVQNQRKEKADLEGQIREKERIISAASHDVAISNLQLELKNEMLLELAEKMDNTAMEDDLKFSELKALVKKSMRSDRNWESFLKHFDVTHFNFFRKLKDLYPNLTTNDEKHCAFLKMKLSNKEVAAITGVTPDAVKKARQRLKIKLNVPSDETLKRFIDKV